MRNCNSACVGAQKLLKDSAGCPYLDKDICPDSANIKITLFTKWGYEKVAHGFGISLKLTNLSAVIRLKPEMATKIITHGLNDDVTAPSFIKLRDELLAARQYNIIMVDWSPLAAGSQCYFTGFTLVNARHTGRCLGALIAKLHAAGNADVHLIGHSMGAHLMSFAANAVRSLSITVSRITGLDPAGPLYNDLSGDSVLDETDAMFVDALHTTTTLGMSKTVGHLDFYLNGAQDQPGCPSSMVDPFGSNDCSHVMAVTILAASVNSRTLFLGTRCADMDYDAIACRNFTGKCDVPMGLRIANNNTGTVVVNTNGRWPFALGKKCH